MIEVAWGRPGPPPVEGWRCCMRCGEYWAPAAAYWCDPGKRLCRACKNDEKRGIWPRQRPWHRKNRWTVDGHIIRRCLCCGKWRPLTDYRTNAKNDKRRNLRVYPYAACKLCCRVARRLKLTLPQYRRWILDQRRKERRAA